MDKLEILAEDYPLDDIIKKYDINPYIVYCFLYEEGYIELEDFFGDEDDEDV